MRSDRALDLLEVVLAEFKERYINLLAKSELHDKTFYEIRGSLNLIEFLQDVGLSNIEERLKEEDRR